MNERTRTVLLPILSAVVFTFLIYFAIGLQLSVLPSYVVAKGFSSLVAGLAISVQYIATLASRPYAGRMADESGPKKSVLYGLVACAISGALLWVSALPQISRTLDFGLLVGGRLALGVGESWISTGSLLWAVARVGSVNTAEVISWNGIATYGALAIGAPLGALIDKEFGFQGIGVTVLLLGAVALPFAVAKRGTKILPGDPLPFGQIIDRVLPFGLSLSLGAVGFGTIAAFITLYYSSRHWSNAVACLSLFGLCFMGARLLFSSSINKRGGFKVALASFAVECVGLLLIWLASTPAIALLGASLSGLGFSLVFPALGVEVVSIIRPENRGSVLGMYMAFLDLALGVAGPVAGLVAGHFGYPAAFLMAALCAVGGAILTQWLFKRESAARVRWSAP